MVVCQKQLRVLGFWVWGLGLIGFRVQGLWGLGFGARPLGSQGANLKPVLEPWAQSIYYFTCQTAKLQYGGRGLLIGIRNLGFKTSG